MTFLKKILLVDHESALTELVRSALESTGKFLVKVERDEAVAWNAARWFLPDLILLDGIAAPVSHRYLTNGASVENTPTLYLHGADLAEQKVATRGFIAGYSFLTGPMPIADLTGWVEELTNSHAAAA